MPTNKELSLEIDAIKARLEKIEEGLHMTKRPSPTPMREREYVVEKGDSLALIAKKMLGNPGRLRDIMTRNDLGSANDVFEGQVLKIPAD